jgi:hypothetical protein
VAHGVVISITAGAEATVSIAGVDLARAAGLAAGRTRMAFQGVSVPKAQPRDSEATGVPRPPSPSACKCPMLAFTRRRS